MIESQTVWQIGSGDWSRDYSRICIEFGIAMVGPGFPGNAKEFPERYRDVSNWGIQLLEVKTGDIVLLRRGQTNIKAVGIVKAEYQYSELLFDIHGWDLNHYLEIDWFASESGDDIVLTGALIGYSTMSKVSKNYNTIKELINKVNLVRLEPTKNLKSLSLPKEITIENLTASFIQHGIRIADASNITDTIKRIITLVNWYNENDPKVLEHELRTFMVVPFLFSLGWSEQKIKIEYNKIDIAVFKRSYTSKTPQDPYIIIETKTFSDGLDFAKEQIKGYAQNYPNCKLIVTTNGFRYNLYKRENDTFIHYSYFSLLDMREYYYLNPNLPGPLDGIISLSNYFHE